VSETLCQFHDSLQVINNSNNSVENNWAVDGVNYNQQEVDLGINFSNVGPVAIELIANNAFGCSDTTSTTIEVLASPIAATDFTELVGCQPFEVKIANLSENSDLTNWILDENNTSNDSVLNHIYLNHGTFESILIASNSNGCPDDTLLIDIQVNPRSIANFHIIEFDSCGIPQDIKFNNLSLESSDFTWKFGDGNSSSFSEPTHTFDSAGNFLIQLNTNNQYDCPDSLEQRINLYHQPETIIEIPDLKLCEGDTLKFINTSFNSNNLDLLSITSS